MRICIQRFGSSVSLHVGAAAGPDCDPDTPSGDAGLPGRSEASLRSVAKSTQHLACHLPKNPFCESRKLAQAFKQPSRRISQSSSKQDEPGNFGEKVTID